jgi:hypothetical protein
MRKLVLPAWGVVVACLTFVMPGLAQAPAATEISVRSVKFSYPRVDGQQGTAMETEVELDVRGSGAAGRNPRYVDNVRVAVRLAVQTRGRSPAGFEYSYAEAEAVTLEALEEAATMYRILLTQEPDHTRLRQDASRALGRLAANLVRTGARDRAREVYGEAIGIVARPVDDTDGESLVWRTTARVNLAALHKEFGDFDRLRTTLEVADRELQQLAELPRRRSAARFGQCQVAGLRAELPEVARDPAALVATLEQAVAFARDATATQPDAPEYQSALVRTLDNLATTMTGQLRGNPAAEPVLEEALAVAKALPPDAAIWPPPAVLESDVLETLGNLFMMRDDDRARATLAACVALRQRIVDAHPADIDMASRLGAALHNLARTHCGSDFDREGIATARELLDRAIPLQRTVLAKAPDYTRARHFLMLHLRLYGNCMVRLQLPAELETVAAELATDSQHTEHQRATARFWLRAMAMREQQGLGGDALPDHRRRALDALLQAERAGWRSKSRLDEAVYAPLAELTEFRELKARLAATRDE